MALDRHYSGESNFRRETMATEEILHDMGRFRL